MPGRQLTYHSQTTVKGFPVNRPIDHEWTCRLVVWKVLCRPRDWPRPSACGGCFGLSTQSINKVVVSCNRDPLEFPPIGRRSIPKSPSLAINPLTSL